MPNGHVLVLAKDPERLRPAFTSIAEPQNITFVDDLSSLNHVAHDLKPEAALMFNDIGFEGREFRELAHSKSIKWVHVSGSGYEYLEPVDRDDVTITNGQGVRSRYLAETLIGAMTAMNCGLFIYRDQQRAQVWQPNEFQPLENQTLLIVGTGLIGTWFARYAKALDMTVIGVNRSGAPTEPFDDIYTFDRLAEALPVADVVSVHLRHTPETGGLFDAVLFDCMKQGSLFLNTARGAIVNETALCDALKSGKLRGAYLDVFSTEPLPADSPFWSMDNVLLTPHAADTIVGWDLKAAAFFVDNLNRWRSGEPLLNVVREATM